jgi:hypothetical protein
MERIIAYCGLICNDCPILIATFDNDQQKKVELANQYSSEDYKVAPEDINCHGCTSTDNDIFKFCNVCEIRLCGMKKDISNCAYCSEYPCNKLEIPFASTPENKTLLDEIKNTTNTLHKE